MVITYHGLQSLKIQFGNTIVAYNPVSKDSKFKSGSYGADIVLVSTNHPDYNGVEQASRGEKSPFVIDGPGEYEVGGIVIRGFLSEAKYGGKKMLNTIYLMTLENINVCFLGALGSPDSVTADTKESLDDIDILFTPISGGELLDPSSAYKLAVKLEPKIIIPLQYDSDGKANSLKTFLKEGGEEKAEAVDKLTLKRKDLEGKEGDIIVLTSSN
jgi:L-ascorbate metabolism protein UlaG (beta-lactamase superfamily)